MTAPEQRVTRTGTTMPHERYVYRAKFWRVREATGLPRWLELRGGRLSGRPPRLGHWSIELSEEGVLRHRGERRRTVLTVRSVTPRAVDGTVLVTRGHDGRPANESSLYPLLSGDGATVVFRSRATNLVPGTAGEGRWRWRTFAWDARTRTTSLVSDRQLVWAEALSHDGRHLLTSNGDSALHLLDLRARTRVQIARRSLDAALTADGRTVLYQDVAGVGGAETAHLVRWDASSGLSRQVYTLPATLRFTGAISPDARFALLGQALPVEPAQPAVLLDLSTGSTRDLPGLDLTSWHFDDGMISTDGSRIALRGSGCVVPDPPPDCGYAAGFVYDVGSSRLVDDGGALRNYTVDMTPDGRFFTAGAPHGHLRLVDSTTGEQWSAFRSAPTGLELGASLADDGSRVAYASTGVDLLHGTRPDAVNIYLWVPTR